MELVTEETAVGSGEGFEDFVQSHYEPLWRAFYLLTGNHEEAEDLAQEAFCRAFERWDRVRDMRNSVGYLYRIGVNAHRSVLRRLSMAVKHSIRPGTPDDSIARVDERDAVRRLLAELPRGQREALVLVDWLGLTSEEAGQALGVAPGTIRVRVTRARRMLRERGEAAADG